MGTLTNSVDLDEMPPEAAFLQRLHCLIRLKNHHLETSIFDPLKYKWAISMLLVELRSTTRKELLFPACSQY